MERVDTSILGPLVPSRVYFSYDGYCLSFLMQNSDRTFYVHATYFSTGQEDYFVREMSQADQLRLERNQVTIRDFLLEALPIYYLVSHPEEAELFRYSKEDVNLDFLPEDNLYLGELMRHE